MKRERLAILLLLAVLAGGVQAQGVDPPEPAVDGRAVQDTLRRLVDYLYSRQTSRGDWEEVTGREAYEGQKDAERLKCFYGGRTALAVLALLYAGEDPKGDRLAKPLKILAEVELTGTYAVALRASVWSKIYEQKRRPLLLRDALWLMEAATSAKDKTVPGFFCYFCPGEGWGDFSNTQYGVLGLRDAAIRGIEVPNKFWEAIEQRMIIAQGADGGWGYVATSKHPPDEETYGNMTVGGLANLYITLERLQLMFEGPFNGREARSCGRRKPPEAIEKALAWFNKNLPVDFGLKPQSDGTPNPRGHSHGMNCYYLYGLERCGNACGRKTFGGLNWFEQGAKFIIDHQNGYPVRSDMPDVAWCILFLSKGQAPVFFNKLDTHADWNNDVRDIPNLSEYIGQELEQRINFQVVDLADPVESWLDAPVLFFNGHDLPKFTDQEKKKLRLYTDSGGTILAEACCSRGEFVRGFKQLARELWPEWELQNLDPRHPLMSFHHQIKGRLPNVLHLHDGCRSRVFLIQQDMSCAWNQNLQTGYPQDFQFGLNLARYASDKRVLRSRLLFYRPPVLKELAEEGKAPPAGAAAGATPLALADWPTDGRRLTDLRSLRHLAELLKDGCALALTYDTMNDQALDRLDQAQVVHMSGHNTFAASDENLEKLRAFLKRGGLLWADPQCGREGFKESFEEFLKKLLPGAQLKDVPADDPLVTGEGLPQPGFDVRRIRYKQALQTKEQRPALKEVRLDGRRAVIYSPYDLTCGLDGHDCPGCLGPERNDALKLAANILLSALPASR